MKLFWHKWKTNHHGTIFLLFDFPQTKDFSIRQLGELAIVSRRNGRWRGETNAAELRENTWVLTGSPLRSRRLLEKWLSKRSIELFGTELLEVIGP